MMTRISSYMQIFLLLFILLSCGQREQKTTTTTTEWHQEKHRPQIHFSPKEKWMNDPNGMVYLNGTYHLFYQYYPESTVWGPMHWGHATSKDLVTWEHQPVALYPDSLGYIFSGSAVVDSNNTSGFGTGGKVPLVAIFTHHDPKGESAGRDDFQYQSLAYSLDEGKTWTKYPGNPVLKNPGIRDFRDPKVSWHETSKKWIMVLAVKDHVSFYSSSNLKDWTKESDFGATAGAHGGVWECPDLFPIEQNGETTWVLFVSINPGGPNGGSATQYFTGKFDGKTFSASHADTRWLDYGPDNYAGVTFSNTGDRRLFLGWMSNWLYATKVPTEKWRSAMTLPRDLGIKKIDDKYYVTSLPSPEVSKLEGERFNFDNADLKDLDLTSKAGKISGPLRINLTTDSLRNFELTLSNAKGQKVVVGYDKTINKYYIDRSRSGPSDFERGFANVHAAPRINKAAAAEIIIIIDDASVELFADGGLSVMTQIFFPDEKFTELRLTSKEGLKADKMEVVKLRSIYDQTSNASL